MATEQAKPQPRQKRKVFDQPTELVAKKRGFYNNRLVERGATFLFKGGEMPSWAVEPGTPLPPEPKLNGDTKPVEARMAVVKKAKGAQAEME